MDQLNYDSLLELVQNRRSCRRFKSIDVPDEMIEQIIEVARWAPSGFDTQPWEFVVLKEKEHRQRIVEITAHYWDNSLEMEKVRPDHQGKKWDLKGMTNQPGDYSEAPVYILVFGDPRTKEALPMGVQCDENRQRLIYQSSLAHAFLYMTLAATTLGLGAQWYSAVQIPYNACLIKDYLGIPQHFDVYDMMVLGYPALKPPKKFLRKREEQTHWGIDNRAEIRSDEEVADFVKKARAWVMGCHAKSLPIDE